MFMICDADYSIIAVDDVSDIHEYLIKNMG